MCKLSESQRKWVEKFIGLDGGGGATSKQVGIKSFGPDYVRADSVALVGLIRRRSFRTMATLRLATLFALAGLGWAAKAPAQTLFLWNDPTGGNFSAGSNWLPGTGPPGAIDGASFNLDAVYTVGFTVNAHTHLASVTDGTVTFDLDTSGTERLYVVDMLRVTGASDPELNIEDGRVDADEILVQNSGQLDVGSDGWLLAFGDFNVDGGLFRVLAGGEFSPIGGAEDTIIVQNGGTFIYPVTSTFVFGGDETFRVESGGAMHTGPFTLRAALRVDGAGSSVSIDGNSNWATVATAATAELTGGGALSIEGDLGLASDGSLGATVTLTVDGAGSNFTQTGGDVIVGHANDGSAAINIGNGGSFTTDGEMTVNPSGQINLGAGGLLDAATIDMSGGTFNFLGGVLRFDEFDGNLLNPGGVLSPAHPVGEANIIGNYTQQEGGALEIEIGGILPGQFDTVTVAGNAILDGALDVSLVNNFEPLLGNSFTILETTFGNVGGTFDAEVMPVFDDLTFDVIYNLKSVVLQVVEALPGDYNRNGVVDAADYVLMAQWRPLQNEVDTPGVVNAADYTAWRTRFGNSGSGAAPM